MIKYIALMREKGVKNIMIKEFDNSYKSKKEVIDTIRFNDYQLVGNYVYTYEQWNNDTWIELRNELVELQKDLRSFSKDSTCSLVKDIKEEIKDIKKKMKKALQEHEDIKKEVEEAVSNCNKITHDTSFNNMIDSKHFQRLQFLKQKCNNEKIILILSINNADKITIDDFCQTQQ